MHEKQIYEFETMNYTWKKNTNKMNYLKMLTQLYMVEMNFLSNHIRSEIFNQT